MLINKKHPEILAALNQRRTVEAFVRINTAKMNTSIFVFNTEAIRQTGVVIGNYIHFVQMDKDCITFIISKDDADGFKVVGGEKSPCRLSYQSLLIMFRAKIGRVNKRFRLAETDNTFNGLTVYSLAPLPKVKSSNRFL